MKCILFTIITVVLFIPAVTRSQTESELLEKAYERNSKSLLRDFFDRWDQAIPAVSDIELDSFNDTVRNTYSAFISFYLPLHIECLGGSEWGNDIYKKSKYIIVQNKIYIYFTDRVFYSEQDIDDYVVRSINEQIGNDSLRQIYLTRTDGKLANHVIENFRPDALFSDSEDKLTDSIINFRPKVNVNNVPAVYLSPAYNELISAFLGDENLPLGSGGIMLPARSKGESENRQIFLEKYIQIWYGHWGGYWQLLTYPHAYSITFDMEMHYARINFRMVYEGGEAILENVNGNWKLISSKRTWIE